MHSKNYSDRPGIEAVNDEQLLQSIGGGVDFGDAILNIWGDAKVAGAVIAILRGLYLYGDPDNQDKVQEICKQTAAGFVAASRNPLFYAIGASTAVAWWIRKYFTARADDTTSTTINVYCPVANTTNTPG